MKFSKGTLAILLSVVCSACFAQKTPLVFMQLADPQMGMFTANQDSKQEASNFHAVLQRANELHPAFVVICGDLTNKTTDVDQLKSFRQTASELKGIPLYLVPGNHDVGNHPTVASLARYHQRFGPDYYSFDSGPLRGIVLDSMIMSDDTGLQESALQYQWLEKTLAASKGREIAVFQHIPFFLHTEDEPDWYWNVPIEARKKYLALLKKYGVHHVFAGHLHYPLEAGSGDLKIVVAGAVGKPLGHSVSGMEMVEIDGKGNWLNQYFPISAMPDHLLAPW